MASLIKLDTYKDNKKQAQAAYNEKKRHCMDAALTETAKLNMEADALVRREEMRVNAGCTPKMDIMDIFAMYTQNADAGHAIYESLMAERH